MSLLVPGSGAETEYLTMAALRTWSRAMRKLIWCEMFHDAETGMAIGPLKTGQPLGP